MQHHTGKQLTPLTQIDMHCDFNNRYSHNTALKKSAHEDMGEEKVSEWHEQQRNDNYLLLKKNIFIKAHHHHQSSLLFVLSFSTTLHLVEKQLPWKVELHLHLWQQQLRFRLPPRAAAIRTHTHTSNGIFTDDLSQECYTVLWIQRAEL